MLVYQGRVMVFLSFIFNGDPDDPTELGHDGDGHGFYGQAEQNHQTVILVVK
jgi:hypothetical protein